MGDSGHPEDIVVSFFRSNMEIGNWIILGTSILVLMSIIFFVLPVLIKTAGPAPPVPKGWDTMDYDALQVYRGSMDEYLSSAGIPDSTPIVKCRIATANFGGIATEQTGLYNPWIGSVSADAARRQVEAGARAIVFDIWPDPAEPQIPILAAMIDTERNSFERRWKHTGGLSDGVGRYSNWHKLTRNVGKVSDILTQAVETAFHTSRQSQDPFFLILNLHGAMTIDYLNRLGGIVTNAVQGHALSAEWNKANNQSNLCKAPISLFRSKVVVIVNPDIQPGYASLPNVHSREAFNAQFLTTTLGEATNVLSSQERPVLFDPVDIAAITAPSHPNCSGNPGDGKQTLAETGLCVIQPSIGTHSTVNNVNFAQLMKTGAQFVAVNLFSPDKHDKTLTSFFDQSLFGKYSFSILK
jgi:hypothetical protein